MAGMLPGVEAARRRRVHQSSSINNSSCSSPSSRRLSFSLFSTNTSTTSASTFLGHTTRSRTSYEDVDDDEDDAKLGALAREAKVRLDAKLRSTPLKSTRNNNRIGRFLNNENEVTRKKKNGKLSWNWKSGHQLELQDKNKNEECAVCLDEMKEGDDIMNLECDHSFHAKCLMPWLQTNAHCPCCRLTAAEQKLSKQQSDNLKWQQNSFHQILNLIGLHKEGLLPDTEVSAFRTHLLDTLIASKGADKEQPQILRDKLLFLQELLYAKCISAEEYHASKRPLLQRLAVQGAELEARDVIVGERKETDSPEEEEWSVIDLKDDQSLINKDNSRSKNRSKHGSSTVKHIKDAASVFGLGSLQKLGKNRQQKSIFDQLPVHTASISNKENENPFWNINNHNETESETKSILMSASDSDKFGKEECHGNGKGKKTAFRSLFQADKSEEKDSKFTKKQWGFDGFKRWKRSNVEDETTPVPLTERSRNEGPDTKQIKRKLLSDGSSSGFYIDKVVGDNIRKELLRIQTELSSTNPNFHFSNDEMDVISTKLPVDKSDLKQYFPKSWCERYGDVVLDVVKKEFKDHVGEMENMRHATWERRCTSSKRWTAFEDDEYCHPNRVSPANHKANSIF